MSPFISVLRESERWVEDISVLDGNGAILPEVRRILDLCKQYDMVLATGHLPIESSMILAEEAAPMGIRLLLTHPLSGSVGASIDQQRAFVALGGMIEHVFVGCMPMHQRADPRQIAEAIRAIGPEHIVLGSDAIEGWNPPAPELLRMFIATLLALGIDCGALHGMTHDNPAYLLQLDRRKESPSVIE
jgi:hypothetical protein